MYYYIFHADNLYAYTPTLFHIKCFSFALDMASDQVLNPLHIYIYKPEKVDSQLYFILFDVYRKHY